MNKIADTLKRLQEQDENTISDLNFFSDEQLAIIAKVESGELVQVTTPEAKQKVKVTAYDDESGAAWKLMFGDETVEDGFDSTADAEMWARDNGYIPVSQEPESYTVTVCRTGYGFAYIEVMARSPEEAEELAMEEAGDHNYSEKASEYTPDGVNKF